MQPRLLLIALVLTAFSGSAAFAQDSDRPAVSKKANTKAASKSKDKSAEGETIIFPKVSKTDKPSDDWGSQSPEHSGRTRGGNGNHPMFR